MAEDLPRLVRTAYSATVRRQRDDTAAFQRAVETILNHRPGLSVGEARREAAVMLAFEPDAASLK
jgi:hypothetical protein